METNETAVIKKLDETPQDWKNLLGILADVRREEGYDQSADLLNKFIQSGAEIELTEEIEYGPNYWRAEIQGFTRWSKQASTAIINSVYSWCIANAR